MDFSVQTDQYQTQCRYQTLGLSKNKVLPSYRTSSGPIGVSTVRTDQIVVAPPDDRKIQILNVTHSFKKQ